MGFSLFLALSLSLPLFSRPNNFAHLQFELSLAMKVKWKSED